MESTAQTSPPKQESSKRRPMHSYMSRKRYMGIMESLAKDGMSLVMIERVMSVIRTEMSYDPDDDPFIAYKRSYLRKKSAETGQTIDVLSGSKRSRERRKQA
jgi:hypothetical protein